MSEIRSRALLRMRGVCLQAVQFGRTHNLFVPAAVVCGAGAGDRHTVVVTADGRLFTSGNAGYGRLGHGGQENELVPRAVEGLAGKKVVGTSAGNEHTVVWTEDGMIFTFGNGADGRLGHGGEEIEMVPRAVEGLAGMKVVGATAGGRHTVVWTEDGRVFSFGLGVDGRLGHGGEENELVPRVVEELAGMKVVGAAAGQDDYTVVWTEDGRIFTFGSGYEGQLGHGGEENELVPRVVEGLAGTKVMGATAGSQHTLVWTDDGRLFSFGTGYEGQLGHGGEEHEPVPRVVEGLVGTKVMGAAAGFDYSVVWVEDGRVFSFGWGAYGQLGHGGEERELVPRVMERLVGTKVVGAAVGRWHTVLWMDNGRVLTCGWSGMEGEVGHSVPRVVGELV